MACNARSVRVRTCVCEWVGLWVARVGGRISACAVWMSGLREGTWLSQLVPGLCPRAPPTHLLSTHPLAQVLEGAQSCARTMAGTPYYFSPELVQVGTAVGLLSTRVRSAFGCAGLA